MIKKIVGNFLVTFLGTFTGLYYAGVPDPVGIALIPALIQGGLAVGYFLKNGNLKIETVPIKKNKISNLILFD